ncbi:MAG: hypothetical protein IKH04_11630 [Kiritimatiellae bacterium]|nr:hypothetical protein [Kiritimatiellia bacterium]
MKSKEKVLSLALLSSAAAAAGTNVLELGFARYSLASALEGVMLRVDDVADRARPLAVCHFDFGEFVPETMEVRGSGLALGGDGGEVVMDISDIFAPEIAEIAVTNGASLAPFRTSPGPEIEVELCCDGISACLRRQAGGNGHFYDFPFFSVAPTNSIRGPVAARVAEGGFVLLACQADGVRIFRCDGDDPPIAVTHCVTDGPALGVAPYPGGFGVALGTKGYALYALDDSGLVTLLRQWPLETGRAVSAAFDGERVVFDCQEGGSRSVRP